MYNRYQGNTGKVVRVEERPGPPARRPAGPPPAAPASSPCPGPCRNRPPALAEQLNRLLPGSLGNLETEDLLLLLILYLMYRESGDSELLMIMGGMFLL